MHYLFYFASIKMTNYKYGSQLNFEKQTNTELKQRYTHILNIQIVHAHLAIVKVMRLDYE